MASVPPFSDGSFCCDGLLFVLVVVVVASVFSMAEALGQVAMLVFGQNSSSWSKNEGPL